MTDTPRRTKSLDYAQVVLDERWQVGYWTTALHCSERELHQALAAVGLLVVDVRRYLAGKGP